MISENIINSLFVFMNAALIFMSALCIFAPQES